MESSEKYPVCQKGKMWRSGGATIIECSQCWFRCHIGHLPRIAAAMDAEKRLVELQEAVRWSHECLDAWLFTQMNCGIVAEMEAKELWLLARAAVDAPVGEG